VYPNSIFSPAILAQPLKASSAQQARIRARACLIDLLKTNKTRFFLMARPASRAGVMLGI
jgi:hypothetical protein